jgi:hypothetical protein
MAASPLYITSRGHFRGDKSCSFLTPRGENLDAENHSLLGLRLSHGALFSIDSLFLAARS